jgi:16S rRNA (uracil1498-N3)-methyltransferase
MGRFFIPPESIKRNTATIMGPEAHHILHVLRLNEGDRIQAFDGTGKLYRGTILDIRNRRVKIHIEYMSDNREATDLEIVLVQALPKKNKMEYIIEKSTELGVSSVIPTSTARTIVKLDKNRQFVRKQRWQKIAQEAAKQCGRATIPQVKDLASWSEVLSFISKFDLRLLFSLTEKTQKLKHILRSQSDVKKAALLIGPEGDFTTSEIKQALKANCIAVSLGSNILKCDTAAFAALTIIKYELG